MADACAQPASRCLRRGLAVLAELNRRRVASAAEIAAATGISRPTVHRLLLALAADGYVRQLGSSEGFTPRERVTELSIGWDTERRVVEVASRRIDRLAEDVEWPIDLCAFEPGTPLATSTMVIRHSTHDRAAWSLLPRSPLGRRIPLCGTAPGRMFLATLRDSDRVPFLTGDQQEECRAIESAAHNGYALRNGGLLPRTASLAVPVRAGSTTLCISMAFIRSTTVLAEAIATYLPTLISIASATEREVAN